MIFYILDIKFKVSFYFLIIMSLLFFLSDDFYLISYLFFICVHELSHIYMMIFYSNQIKEVALLPFGVKILKNQNFSKSYKSDFIILSSGIISNMTLFLVFKLIYIFKQDTLFLIFSNMNLAMGIFNLLPVSVLDGGQMLEIILINYFGVRGIKIYKIISIFISFFILILSIYLFVFNYINITIVITSIYLFVSSIK